jgi:serine/threonine-protein kinase HipA
MKRVRVFVHDEEAGYLEEKIKGQSYRFLYHSNYAGKPVSLTMPIDQKEYLYDTFPPFFEGLLPEGIQLEGLLKHRKIDRDDYFEQLLAVGDDLVGAVSVQVKDE